MAQDKRGRTPEPDVDEVLDELAADEGGGFVAGPTSRNEAGDTKRAAAKATGQMGASKKVDPDLMVDPEGNRPKSGSKAAIHSFQEVPPEKGVTHHQVTRDNAEIVDFVEHRGPQVPSPAGRTGRRDRDRFRERGARRGPRHGRAGAHAGSRQSGQPSEGAPRPRRAHRERGRRPLAILHGRGETPQALGARRRS